MVKYLRKILAIVMVFTLCAGLVPYVSAEEIAVPTTAGTGSEVTLAAVITDDETHYK